jgi:putative flippase GtrA
LAKGAPYSSTVRGIARGLLAHSVAREFARYFAAGLIALGIDFGLYVALTEMLGWHYLVSATLAFCAGLATIYFLSIWWIFRHRRVGRSTHEFALFAGIGAVGLLLTAIVLYLLTDVVGLDYRLSKIAAAAIVFLFNFGCRKYFLFR